MTDIVERLRELSAARWDKDAWERETTVRIPAEPERDIDLVLSSAADEITRLRAELAEKEACIEELCAKEKNYLAELRVARKELAAMQSNASVVAACNQAARLQQAEAELAAIKGQEPAYYRWKRKDSHLDACLSSNCGPHPSYEITPLYALPVADKDAERLLGLCKWAAGRLTDAGDDEGSAKVMESLAAIAKGE